MRKLLFTLAVVFAGYFASQAQVNPHAIGARLGGGSFYGAELSYQHGLGTANRLELDLGWGGGSEHSRMFLSGIFHWNWNIVEGLNWYVGPGASLGYYSYKNSNSSIGVALGGQIGLEYDFNTLGAPLLLSLDVRPMWDFLGDARGFGWGTALGVRYTF
ncbi:MAG: hypothetical protein GX879_05415 [Bacteroidales bacterium]|nr:hypothetical protein [Bacteroidales bacterium]